MAEAGFFSPWESPPKFAEPPQDSALEQRVSKVVEFAARNGPNFIDLMRTKQQQNPEYAFLFTGEGSEFYRWSLYCKLYNLPADQPLPGREPGAGAAARPGGETSAGTAADSAAQQQGQQQLEAAQQSLPAEVDQGFSQVLDVLTGKKESIKNSRDWFLACHPYAAGMAAKMAARLRQLDDYDRQLHVLYLANDILLKALSSRPEESNPEDDDVAQAFQPVLGHMLAAVLARGSRAPEVKDRLLQIIRYWGERGVYDEATLDEFEHEMATASVAGAAAASGPAVKQEPGLVKQEPGLVKQEAVPQGVMGRQGEPSTSQPAGLPLSPQPPGGAHMGMQPPAWQHPTQPGYQLPQASGAMPWAAQPPGQLPQGIGGPPMQNPAAPWAQQQYTQPGIPGSAMPPMQQGFAAPQYPPQQYMPPAAQPVPPAGSAMWYPPPPTAAVPSAAVPGMGFAPMGMPGQAMPGMPGTPGYLPPGAAYPPLGVPSAMMVPPPVAPQPQGYDPMSFPPGLIPQLVRAKLEVDEPYTPLSPREIERAGLPQRSEPDAYLKSRLDKFFAELEDYRPGMIRADEKRRYEEDNQERSQRLQRVGSSEAGPGMNEDGSFSSGLGGGGERLSNAGLGFSANANLSVSRADLDDVYDSYRRMRSGAYKEVMAKSQAAQAQLVKGA